MLLMQRFFQRYSGLPSYLVGAEVHQDLAGSLLTARTALVPTVLSNPLLLPTLLRGLEVPKLDSLFVATWSLTEASYEARAAIRPHLRGFGRLFITFWDKIFWDKKADNGVYLAEWIREDFLQTHYVCSWQITQVKDAKHWYLVVAAKELGEVKCLERLGCYLDTLHPTLVQNVSLWGGSTCVPENASARLWS